MIILGIETSCDETALAIIETRLDHEASANGGYFEYRILGSLILSQAELHSPYGGVFPTLAKREHAKNIIPLLKDLFDKAEIHSRQNTSSKDNHGIPSFPNSGSNQISETEFNGIVEKFKKEFNGQNPELLEAFVRADFLRTIPLIDRIAVTEGPGLEPALWVGINCAQILSELWHIPIVPVNHMEGHIVGSLLESDKADGVWQRLKTLPLPSVALLISGGHTELIKIDNHNATHQKALSLKYDIIGQTRDDAVGEAFDKVARLLNLPYPGGPHISKLAQEAAELDLHSSIKLPRPMINSGDLDFSFSGLKTAVLYAVRFASEADGQVNLQFKQELSREFEQAVAETLETKLRGAIEQTGAQSIIIGGGVAANKTLRTSFQKIAEEYGVTLFLPSQIISGDNALMIALAGSINDKTKVSADLKANGTKRL